MCVSCGSVANWQDGGAHDHDATPHDCNGSKEYAGANLSHDDRCRRLADDVWDEEDEGDDTVSVDTSGFELEVNGHPKGQVSIGALQRSTRCDSPSNVGGAQISSVHQTDAVHGAEGEHKAAIDFVHDASLLFVCEAGDARVLLLGRRRGDILIMDASLLHVRIGPAIMAVSDLCSRSLSAAVVFAGEEPHGCQVAVSTLSGSEVRV